MVVGVVGLAREHQDAQAPCSRGHPAVSPITRLGSSRCDEPELDFADSVVGVPAIRKAQPNLFHDLGARETTDVHDQIDRNLDRCCPDHPLFQSEDSTARLDLAIGATTLFVARLIQQS